MTELRYSELPTPESAIRWFEAWPIVKHERDLSVVAEAELGAAVPIVLLAACREQRRNAGLATTVRSQGGELDSGPVMVGMDSSRSVSNLRGPEGGIILGAITSLHLARTAADAVEKSFQDRVPAISPSFIRMARFVFEELGANVVQHANAAQTGYGWADLRLPSRAVHLAFADCGIGILASLQRNPELQGRVADDAAALQLALTARVSGTGPARTNMGWGLKALVDLSDLLDGDLYVASGSALFTRRTLAGQRTNVIRAVPPWQGVWISLEAQLR